MCALEIMLSDCESKKNTIFRRVLSIYVNIGLTEWFNMISLVLKQKNIALVGIYVDIKCCRQEQQRSDIHTDLTLTIYDTLE